MSKSRGRVTKPRNWSVTHHGRNVHVVKVKASTSRGWEQWLYLRSDAHTDNAKADHALEVRHLKEAVERDAIIIDCGDALDTWVHEAMHGIWPDKGEEEVASASAELSGLLWRLGYRRPD